MSKNQLALNMFANIVAFVLNLGINLVLTPYIINNVGAEAYGFIPLANNFISYVTIFTVALNSMAARYISIELAKKNTEEANIYFNSVLIANGIISLVVSAPAMLMLLKINHIINVPNELLRDVQLTFLFVFLNLLMSLLGNVFAIATFAKNRVDLTAKINIITNLIRSFLVIAAFAFFAPKIFSITLTAFLAAIFGLYYNIRYTKELTPELKINRTKFRMSAIKELLANGIWNSVNQLSTVLLTMLDLVLANIFINPLASGQYAIAKTIPNFIQSFVGTLVGVFVPEFTVLYGEGKKEALLKSIDFSIKIMGLVITLPIAFLLVNGDLFFGLWVPGQDISKLYWLSTLTIVPMIVTGSMNTVYNVYTVTSKLKIPATVLLITGVLNTMLVLILLMYTDLGIYSIPLVSFVIGLLRNLIFTPIYAARCLEVHWGTFYKAILRGITCTFTMMFVTYVLRVLVYPDGWIKLIGSAGIGAIISLGCNSFLLLSKEEKQLVYATVDKKIRKKR